MILFLLSVNLIFENSLAKKLLLQEIARKDFQKTLTAMEDF